MKKNREYLYDLIRTGFGNNPEQTDEFINKFNLSDCAYIDEFNTSLLQKSISSEKYDIANFLIKQKCNLDNQDDRGYTALHYILASKDKQDYELIDNLLEQNPELELKDYEYGNTPLIEAVMNAKIPLSILEQLLKKGANPHHENKSKMSPYKLVLRYNIKELLDLFSPYL